MSVLIDRLVDELGWPCLTSLSEVQSFVSTAGVHVLFLAGGDRQNLETPDVAVILPELVATFGGRFDVGVVADDIDRVVRETEEKYAVPNLFFYRDGHFVDELPKVRDWDEYLSRITQILEKSEHLPQEGARHVV